MTKLYIDLKGAYTIMVREYMTPDFDVTVYEIDDVITVSWEGDKEGTGYVGAGGNGDGGWWD